MAKYKETAKRLRDARKEKGLSQSALANKAGLSPSAISNFEQGIRRPREENAEALARVFDLPAAYFEGTIDRNEAEIIKTLRTRSET